MLTVGHKEAKVSLLVLLKDRGCTVPVTFREKSSTKNKKSKITNVFKSEKGQIMVMVLA